MEIYARTVKGKVREMEVKKKVLAEALTNAYTLMGKVHGWSGNLALNNHEVNR